MHRADVLVIGPLEPLLPRPICVRLGVVVASAAALVCVALAAALVIALQLDLLPVSVPESLAGWTAAHGTAAVAPVEVTSSPAGARILLGNRELGSTPAAVGVSTGQILTVRREGFLDGFTRASGPTLEVPLWRSEPEVQLVRPPMPGAAIRSADFLPDGRVALAIEVPPTERQHWAYDPDTAHLLRLGNAPAPGALPSAVAIAPDGVHTAAIMHLDGLDGAVADQLVVDGPEGPRQPLSNLNGGERLLDVSWSPNADGVLLLSQRRVTGGAQFLIRWIGIDGDTATWPTYPESHWLAAGSGRRTGTRSRSWSTPAAPRW